MPLPRLPRVPRFLKRRPKPGSGDFSWDYDEYTPGNKLTLYTRGGDLFAAMAAAIEEARESVHLETYIFGNDDTGRTFAQLLAQKARTGVPTRLIFDSVGSIDMDPRLETLMRNAGVKILEYHPVAPWRPRWAWNKRDHRKILVVDNGAFGERLYEIARLHEMDVVHLRYAWGDLVTVTDALAFETTHTYYGRDHRRTSTIDARGGITAFAYDELGRIGTETGIGALGS